MVISCEQTCGSYPRGCAGVRLAPSFLDRHLPWLLLLAIAAADVLAHRWNLAILFTIPLLLYARHTTPGRLWTMTVAVVLATYLGLLLPHLLGMEGATIAAYRVFNRTLVAIAVVVIAGTGQYISLVRRRAIQGGAETMSDPDRRIYDELIATLERFLILLSCATVSLAIVAIDLASPQTQNYSILYTTVVILAAQSRSRGLLWISAAVIVVLVWLGFSVSLFAEDHQVAGAASVNRSLTSMAIVGVALLCHIWLRAPKSEG